MATVREIYQYLDGLAPFSLQMEFDNAGFLVGPAAPEDPPRFCTSEAEAAGH